MKLQIFGLYLYSRELVEIIITPSYEFLWWKRVVLDRQNKAIWNDLFLLVNSLFFCGFVWDLRWERKEGEQNMDKEKCFMCIYMTWQAEAHVYYETKICVTVICEHTHIIIWHSEKKLKCLKLKQERNILTT